MVFFFEAFDRGKWSGVNTLKTKLRKGGIIKPHEGFATVAQRKKFGQGLIFPKNLHQVKIGNKADLRLTSADDSKLTSSIQSVSKTPVLPGIYDLSAEILLPKGFIPPTPGSTCTLECVTYHRIDAITLPTSVIHSAPDDADSKFIYILNKKGKLKKEPLRLVKNLAITMRSFRE